MYRNVEIEVEEEELVPPLVDDFVSDEELSETQATPLDI
jgi:hypothetical protein